MLYIPTKSCLPVMFPAVFPVAVVFYSSETVVIHPQLFCETTNYFCYGDAFCITLLLVPRGFPGASAFFYTSPLCQVRSIGISPSTLRIPQPVCSLSSQYFDVGLTMSTRSSSQNFVQQFSCQKVRKRVKIFSKISLKYDF